MFFKKKEKFNREDLKNLFESQKQTLLEKGYAQLLGEGMFEREIQAVWQQLESQIEKLSFVKQGNIPLLLVVNLPDINSGMEKIHAHTELDLAIVKSPTANGLFSILLDVEDGRKMVAKSPKDSLKRFEKDGRHALTIHQSLALLTHYPDLLKHHYVISVGSFYPKDNENLPLLWLMDEHKNPELHYAWFHIAHGSYGVPSYAVKI